MIEQAPKSCSKCAAPLSASARFCTSCGEAVPQPGHADTVPDSSALRAPTAVRPSVARRIEDPTADPLIGQVVADRYRIVSLLGRGGMGVVYKVEHVHIGKVMAMKLLSGRLARDPQTIKRFRREAKTVSKLAHPNTVQIFDFGQSANLAYLVMEYLPGRDLATVIEQDGPLPFVRVARIAAQVAASVAEAHASGVIHRDIKPENVMVLDTSEQADFVKVLDFGIAKLRDSEDAGAQTLAGHLVGTPYYMSPEQIRAEPYDHRVDVYALGALMYKALAGVAPFVADTPLAVLQMHLSEPLIPVRARVQRPDVPAVADEIIARAMQKDPADRYPDMESFRVALLNALRSLGDTASSLIPPSPRAPSFARSRRSTEEELATRGDVDRYERGLRRTSWITRSFAFVLMSAAASAGYVTWTERALVSEGDEKEPNNEPAQAMVLRSGAQVTGQIGKRLSEAQSDADVYAFDVPVGSTSVLRAEVTALPNIDLVLDLVRAGETTPVLVVDRQGEGVSEIIPNMALRGGRYYVRVREVWGRAAWATENISDHYMFKLRLSAPQEDMELELNETIATATRLRAGQAMRGYVGWEGDRDVYCVEGSELPARVSVSGLPSVDLVLTRVTRGVVDAEAVIDARGLGEGESVDLEKGEGLGPCVIVSAQRPEGTMALESSPERPYELSVAALSTTAASQ